MSNSAGIVCCLEGKYSEKYEEWIGVDYKGDG
jgi:hypothetical protein